VATEVLLWEDVPAVGRRGEVVRVSEGYARNYLLPRKLALRPTPGNRKLFEREKERLARRAARRQEKAGEIAAAIEKTSVTIEVKANPDGLLYGSVDARVIADAFRKAGVPVTHDMVELPEPIKKIAKDDVYTVAIRPHGDVVATGKVWIIASKE
jgi:large subunit ribosomal protein L9